MSSAELPIAGSGTREGKQAPAHLQRKETRGGGCRIGASIKLSGVPCEVVYEPHAVRCGPSASRKG